MPKNLFVTGGSGYVGQAFLRSAVKQGYTVHGLADSASAIEEIERCGATAIEGKLEDPSSYSDRLRGMDAIVHLAAKIDLWGPYEEFYSANVSATQRLLQTAIEHGINRFIYLSSASVVMGGKPLRDITEEYRPKRLPRDNYSRSKAKAEDMIRQYDDRLQVVILRPPFLWGPGMKWIDTIRPQIEKNGLPSIGDPDHTLASCHIENLIEAIYCSLKTDYSGVYFVTDGDKRPLRFFLRDFLRGYGLDAGKRQVKKRAAMFYARFLEWIWKAFRLGGSPPLTRSIVHMLGTEFSIDDSKARAQLGYAPVITVDEGLQRLSPGD